MRNNLPFVYTTWQREHTNHAKWLGNGYRRPDRQSLHGISIFQFAWIWSSRFEGVYRKGDRAAPFRKSNILSRNEERDDVHSGDVDITR